MRAATRYPASRNSIFLDPMLAGYLFTNLLFITLAPFTVGDATILSEDRVLTQQDEREMAWIFMTLGEWAEQDVRAIVEDGKLSAIEFSWLPNERAKEGTERFEMIGTLSRMFSRHYTQQANGKADAVQIELEHRSNWFAPLISADYKSDALPLWRFV